jgi:hypothetical protein
MQRWQRRAVSSLVAGALAASVVPSSAVAAPVIPNDPDLDRQPELVLIGAPQAWEVTRGKRSIVVAVLDTLVDVNHPDLAGKLVSPYDATNQSECDPSGATRASASHGTVVAGLIAATTDNQLGIAGLGWDTRVMPIRVLCDDGSGYEDWVANGIRYAVRTGASIINISVAGDEMSSDLTSAIAEARAAGVLIVASAGNGDYGDNDTFTNTTVKQFPAAVPDVISVGATTLGDQIADFSRRGTWVDLMAPGDGVFSTTRGGRYSAPWRGSSFAAPYVAATAALIQASRPGITPAGVEWRLRASATPIRGLGTDMAWGRLNAGLAVSATMPSYWMVGRSGRTIGVGDAAVFGRGDVAGTTASAIVITPSRQGAWVVGANGAIVATGDAPLLTAPALRSAVVGAAGSGSTGLWLATADGGVFTVGSAPFYGSAPTRSTNPTVGIVATPTGRGYWLVRRDGTISAFGDAARLTSKARSRRASPIVSAAVSATGGGLWLLAADGSVATLGDAVGLGRTPPRSSPAVGLVPSTSGRGYAIVTRDGGMFIFGDALFAGSAAGRVTEPVTAVAAASPLPVAATARLRFRR